MLNEQQVAKRVRGWIAQALDERPELTCLAVGQRAKFEGWLKFELACKAIHAGATDVVLEAPLPKGTTRADLGFTLGETRHVVELKTPNANWRMPGVVNKGRPVTMNIEAIIIDGRKMLEAGAGIVAFTLFPVPVGDTRWREYLHRIGDALDLTLSEERQCERVRVSLGAGHQAEIIVCAFAVETP